MNTTIKKDFINKKRIHNWPTIDADDSFLTLCSILKADYMLFDQFNIDISILKRFLKDVSTFNNETKNNVNLCFIKLNSNELIFDLLLNEIYTDKDCETFIITFSSIFGGKGSSLKDSILFLRDNLLNKENNQNFLEEINKININNARNNYEKYADCYKLIRY